MEQAIYTYPHYNLLSECKCNSYINQENGKYCIYNDRSDLPSVTVTWHFVKPPDYGIESRVSLHLPAYTRECYGVGGDVHTITISYPLPNEWTNKGNTARYNIKNLGSQKKNMLKSIILLPCQFIEFENIYK